MLPIKNPVTRKDPESRVRRCHKENQSREGKEEAVQEEKTNPNQKPTQPVVQDSRGPECNIWQRELHNFAGRKKGGGGGGGGGCGVWYGK